MRLTAEHIFIDPAFRCAVHRQETDISWRFAEHDHHGFCELVFVERGTVFQRVNQVDITLPAGGLMLIRERDRHALWGRGFRYHNLNIAMSEWSRLTEFAGEALPLARLMSASAPPQVRLSPSDRRRLAADLRLLFTRQTDPEVRPLLARVLLEWLPHLVSALPKPPTERERGQPSWLPELLTTIERELETGLDTPALPRRAGVSAAHLSRSFRRHLGVTPSQYLNQRRLERAALLLARSEREVLDICFGLGFRSASYFYRRFRSAHAATPAGYRKRHRAG